MSNIVIEVQGDEHVYQLRYAKILYNELGKALYGKEMKGKEKSKPEGVLHDKASKI